MTKKSTTPSDEDIADILDQLSSPNEEAPSAEAVEDDRPITINLPERADPTKLVATSNFGDFPDVPAVVPVVEPLTTTSLPNTPAFDNNGNPIFVASPNPAHTVTAHVPIMNVQQAQTAQVIHEVTPIAEDLAHHPSKEESDVCASYGVNVWWEESGAYWSIRQGPRVGGIPKGASLDEWKSRCAAISVTQSQPKGPSN